MGMVRDGVRGYHYRVLGFCWLADQCLMIIQPQAENLGDNVLRLLKRYHFWLLQRGTAMTEFKFQILEIQQESWLLDSLRFLHQQAVISKTVDDAMDYHWHSHHVYNGFWSLNWLDTDTILNMIASNRLAAMNRFRQYMQHPHRLDFNAMFETKDCSKTYFSGSGTEVPSNTPKAIAEVNSQYHQSMLDRTLINLVIINDKQHIQVRVVDEPAGLQELAGRLSNG